MVHTVRIENAGASLMSGSVLFVLPRFGFGGAERVAADILGYLAGQGLSVSAAAVALPRRGAANSGAVWFAPVCQASQLNPKEPLFEQLDTLIGQRDVSTLVLCGRSPVYELLPRLRGRRPGLRVVSFQFNAKQLATQHRQYAPYIDAIIAESFDTLSALTVSGAVQAPAVVVSSGVPVAALSGRLRPASGERLTVGYVGRFDRTKNPGGYLRMVKLLQQRDYRFVMAGMAPPWFRAPKNVAFHGMLLGEPLQAFVDAIDILVVPSRNDGRPLIIQEAQARGIPVVASAVGGIPELIEHEVTGLLCPAGDHAALAAAVDRLAADPALRQRLGEAGRARVMREGDIAVALPRYAAAITGVDRTVAA